MRLCVKPTVWGDVAVPVAFSYPQGLKGFKRSYISGFVGGVDTTDFVYDGLNLSFQYLAPLYLVVLRVDHRFRPASSNFYTLDYVFDAGESECYLSGVPVSVTIGVAFYPMKTEPAWRIRVQATLPVDENFKADLPQLTDYWRPLWS